MKTQFLIPEWYKSVVRYQNDADLLENFVLAHDTKGELWKKPLGSLVDAEAIALDRSGQEVEGPDRLRKYSISRLLYTSPSPRDS